MDNRPNPLDYQKFLVRNPTNVSDSFCQNVYNIKAKTGLTWQKIADGSGVSTETLKSIVTGENKDYKISTATKLANYFNITVDEMIGASTLDERTLEAMQMLRGVPQAYKEFLFWSISYGHNLYNKNEMTRAVVPFFKPECDDKGNVKFLLRHMTGTYDISNVPPDKATKVICAIQICCNEYAPKFFKGNVILIANDRHARPNEICVVEWGGYLYFGHRKEETENGQKVIKLYSLKDNTFRAYEEQVNQIIGYVADIMPE